MTAHKYLDELRGSGIDTLVLGCTHYPLLAEVIGEIMGGGVKLINSASVVAQAVKDRLKREGLLNASNSRVNGPEIDFPAETVQFYTSDSVAKFRELGGKFLKSGIESVEKVDIEAF